MISVIQFYFIQRWVKLKLGCFEEERKRQRAFCEADRARQCCSLENIQVLCLKSLEITLDPLQGWCLWNVWLQTECKQEVKFQQNGIACIIQAKKCGQIPTEEDKMPCPPCGLLMHRGSGLGALSFFCPESLAWVSHTGWEDELAAGPSCGYHFPGMETPHSYQPT